MKVIVGLFLIAFNVNAVELGSFIPLHFSCVDQSVHTDLGVVDARLDVFRKGTTFNAQLILSKDNAFVTGYKQASMAKKQNGVVNFIPHGHAFQIAQTGAEVALQDAAISIIQLASKEIQIRFNSRDSSQTDPFITYATVNCR